MTSKPTCHRCGQVIGVYEPMVLVGDGEVRETSRAATPTCGFQSTLRYHRDCFRVAEDPQAA